SYCLCFLRQERSGTDSVQMLATIKCRYVDRFERRRGEWRIADRIVVFDESREDMIENILPTDWVTQRRSFDDPVYTRTP
ncbi:nuclear transport factor 2 family protein, partial [Rhodococcus erythropolis]|nr:nuclear transport factor 2 family protein [Rhodococcus erythropolis]